VDLKDERHLRRAIELAVAARADGNPPFGSLIVGPNGDVLAEERNTTVTDSDITAHPELKLARWVARNFDPDAAAGLTMYTSCQPCGMCAGAIERSGLGRVVFALSSEQLAALRPRSTVHPVALEGPAAAEGSALFDEARAAVEGYYS